jgi:TolA-binding protein
VVAKPNADEITARSDSDAVGRSSGSISPSSDEKATLKASIEGDRNQLAQMKLELDDMDREIEQSKDLLNSSKVALDLMKNQNDVDEPTYNRAVSGHNRIVDRYNQLLRNEKEKAALYHALVIEVNGSIDRYNGLVRQK